MEFSSRGIKFMEEREGREKFKYPDSRGLATIGIGHLLSKSELMSGKIWIGGEAVRWREGLTDEQIDTLLLQDLRIASDCVNYQVKVSLKQCEFDALVSFVFNIGVGAFKNSTCLKRINASRFDLVPYEMKRWKYDGENVCQGLINRRVEEVLLWEGLI